MPSDGPKLVKTKKRKFGAKSAPYHPQTNGAVERANQTLKSRIYASDNETTWDDALDEILHSINCSENVVTGFSPFQIETGLQGENIFDVVEHEAKVRQNVGEIRQQTKAKILEEKRVRHLKHENLDFKPFRMGEFVLMDQRKLNESDRSFGERFP